MNTYLTIMVTILVLTQIVRIIQNTIQLRRQYKLFQAQLGQLDDITQEDLDMQRRAYRLIVDYLERHEKKYRLENHFLLYQTEASRLE